MKRYDSVKFNKHLALGAHGSQKKIKKLFLSASRVWKLLSARFMIHILCQYLTRSSIARRKYFLVTRVEDEEIMRWERCSRASLNLEPFKRGGNRDAWQFDAQFSSDWFSNGCLRSNRWCVKRDAYCERLKNYNPAWNRCCKQFTTLILSRRSSFVMQK